MKKLMLVVAMILGLAAMSFAQSGQTGSSASNGVNISTIVWASVSVAPVQDLAFGILVQGNSKTINSNDAAPAKYGEFDVKGNDDATLTLTWTTPNNLTLKTGTEVGSVTFTPGSPIYNTTNDNQSGTQSAASNLTLSATGEAWVFVGGAVTVSSDATPGEWDGTYTLQVAY